MMKKNKIKVLHIITGLENGGAEGVLFRLLANSPIEFNHYVISLTGIGKYGALIQDLGIEVVCLNMKRGYFGIKPIYKLIKCMKVNNPSIVQTWMHHSDLIGGLIAYFLGIRCIFWNLRTAELHPIKTKFRTHLVVKLCSYLSYFVPLKIVSCSSRAIKVHKSVGYSDNFVLIPNGFDTSQFSFKTKSREKYRKIWGVQDSDFVIGMVARFDPQKDHMNLFKSLEVLYVDYPNIKCIFVGKEMSDSNKYLIDWFKKNKKLKSKIILMGQQDDIAGIMNGIDLHVLPSLFGEGFPNVLAESMACGTPCVATNVGDAAEIVGDEGWIIKPGDNSELCKAILSAYKIRTFDSDKWIKLKNLCIEKVKKKYDIGLMTKSYSSLWSNNIKSSHND
jgi:glycosyltransferase involved in cell wall biosynthesis